MRFVLILLVCLLNYFMMLAQNQIYEFDFEATEVNVRTDTAYYLKKVDLNVPFSGYAIVTVEGTSSVSAGDEVIFAASIYKTWLSTGAGNVAMTAFGDLQNEHRYSHRMIYPVQPGQRSFYALAHNWTDRNGTGLISTQGKLTVELIPEAPQGKKLVYQAVRGYPLPLTEEEVAIDTFDINLLETSKIMVSFMGRNYSLEGGNIIYGLRLLDNNQTITEGSTFHPWRKKYELFGLQEMIELGPGLHQIQLYSRKTEGVMENPNNAVYGNFYAETISEQSPDFLAEMADVNVAVNNYESKIPFVNKKIEIPGKGKLMLMLTGEHPLLADDSIQVNFLINQGGELQNHAVKMKNTHPDSRTNHLMILKVFDVHAGPLDLDVSAIFSKGQGISLPASVLGKLRIEFMAEEVTTGINNTSLVSEPQWTVYPNPTTGEVNISGQGEPQNQPLFYKLFSADGKALSQASLTDKKPDLLHNPTGLYFLVLSNYTSSQTITIYKSE